MKRCSTSNVIREFQIKTTIRYHYTSIRMTKMQNTDNTKHWQGCGARGILTHCWWEWKMVQPLQKTVWQFLTKLNILLPYNPATALLCIYPKELKTCPHKNMHMDVYSSFTHNCQNLDTTKLFFSKWMINKLWYIQTMEYYSAVKRNELSSHVKTFRKLKCKIAKWKKPVIKATYYMISTLRHSGKAKLRRQ